MSSERHQHSRSNIDISVIVPVHNEEGNVQPLYERLVKVLDADERSFEVLFIDDGSTDDTPFRLAGIRAQDSRVGVVTLRKNFGQTAGLAAGFDHCRGDIVVTMDGDLQHEPEDLPALLEPLKNGYDIASGWRKDRGEVDSLVRTLPSRMANGAARRISNVQLRDFGTTYKAYTREIIDELELHGQLHRFIPALAAARGARIAEVPIASAARHSGESHYGLSRTWAVLIDLMVLKFLLSYLGRPLRMFAAIGLPLFGIGFFVALAVTIQFYFFTENIGYGNLIFAALLMILGAQFIGMGLVAEIGARNYARIGNQRLYATRSVSIGNVDETYAARKMPDARSTHPPQTETSPSDLSAGAPQP